MRLADDIKFTILNDHCIFLDSERNRYFALPTELDSKFQEFLAQRPEHVMGEHISKLVALGILVDAPENKIPESLTLKLPTQEFHPPPSFTASGFCSATARRVAAIASIRVQSLKPSLHRLRRLKQRALENPKSKQGQLDAIASSFVASRWLISDYDRCLPTALSLSGALIAKGICACFVIGVKSEPFHAHSWVQLGNVVINDQADYVSGFQPILVI